MFENLGVVEAGLIEFAYEEKDPDSHFMVASLIQSLITVQTFPSYALMDIARSLAYSGQSDEVVVACGVAYCEGMQKEPFPSAENLWTVADFATFPFAQIRCKALQTIESTLTKLGSASVLLEETEMIENFALIIAHGSDADCHTALKIVRQLSHSSRHHAKLCNSSFFLATLVTFVAKDEVLDRNSHFCGVEIVLALLSNDDNTELFLPHRHLLPWLVTFLNKTTADESFKETVVGVIIRLSTAYLKRDY
jgi:hypothetical protein